MASEQEEFEFRLRLEQERAPRKPKWSKADQSGALAAGDAALSIGTGILATPIAGFAGIASMPFVGSKAGDVVRKTANALTYQPRTKVGRGATEAISAPFVKLSELGDRVGGNVTDATGSPAAGAAANTALNALPMWLGARFGKSGRVKPTGEIDIKVLERAEDLAGRSGLDWAKLPGEVRNRFISIAEDATQLKDADTVSLQRISRGESLPVPVRLTKGQASRDPSQLRSEENIAQLDAGKSLRDRHIEQNQAIIENLDVLRERAGPKSSTPEAAGARIAADKPRGDKTAQEGALAMAERKSKENISALYKKADNSPEAKSPVNPGPLIDWLTENGAGAASVPEINSLAQMLKKFGGVDFTPDGKAIPRRKFTMAEMEEIRKLAVKLDPNDGKAASHFMKEAKRVIDQSTADAGGDLYKAARKARNEHALKFEEPQAIAKLLDDKSRTDRKVALEDVWDRTVLGGSVADIQRVRDTLLNQKDRLTRDAGRKAWRDVAAQTVEYIREQSTKSVAQDAAGNPNISPAAMKRAMDKIGDKKLDTILGKSTADQLRNLVQVTQDTKTLPPYKGGSTTAPNLLSVFDKIVGKVESAPLVGPITGGAVRLGRAAYKSGVASKEASAALRNPLRQTRLDQGQISLRDLVTTPSVSSLVPLSGLGQFSEPQ